MASVFLQKLIYSLSIFSGYINPGWNAKEVLFFIFFPPWEKRLNNLTLELIQAQILEVVFNIFSRSWKVQLKNFTGLYEDKTLDCIIFALHLSPKQHNLA